MKRMREKDIPAFVEEVIASGCEICAVGHRHYVIGDADLPMSAREAIDPELRRIDETYGTRDHLRLQIVAHLRAIGRYIDVDRAPAAGSARSSSSRRR